MKCLRCTYSFNKQSLSTCYGAIHYAGCIVKHGPSPLRGSALGRIWTSIKYVQIHPKLECDKDSREAHGALRIPPNRGGHKSLSWWKRLLNRDLKNQLKKKKKEGKGKMFIEKPQHVQRSAVGKSIFRTRRKASVAGKQSPLLFLFSIIHFTSIFLLSLSQFPIAQLLQGLKK